MKNKTIYLRALVFMMGLSCIANAQIAVNKSSGCAPLTQVEFISTASGSWDFGDGASGGTGDTVLHSYSSPGVYQVTKGGESTTITVFSNPSPSFNVSGDSAGCVPLNTSFQDASTGGGGTSITKWDWTFGDGGGATTSSPNYTYGVVGTFNVSLIVTDANGCDSSITRNNLISVTNAPSSSFSLTPSSACVGPLDVSFTNFSQNSTGGTSDLTYTWDFGNGQTSTDKDPGSQTYTTEGTYVVKLTVTEAGGCARTSSRVVNIGNPVAIPDLPDTVCLNRFIQNLGNNSVGASSYIWTFENGPTYNTRNPSHTFNVAGDQQITLTANSNQGCSDDTTFVVYVEQANVEVSRLPTYLCEGPYCFSFDGQTTNQNVEIWNWDFGVGDGNQIGPEDTSYCYPITDSLYYVHEPYYYNVRATVITTNGCSATKSYTDTIYPVSAFFKPDVSQGCAPLTVNFSDSTRSREDIVSWQYDFGDGSTANDTNPTHTFTTPGEYEVVLIAENSAGCKDTSYPVTISVGETIPVNFTVTPSSVCVGESVNFSETSGNPNIDFWHYATNNNKSTDCINSGDQSWAGFDEVGFQDVTLSVNYNGCISSSTQSNAIEVKGPVASLKYSGLCANPLDYTFTGTIQGATSWDWSFGDGVVESNSSDSTVSHSYAASGDYIVSLITFNNSSGCENDTQTIAVKVRQVKAVITGDSSICNGVSYNYTGINSVDGYNNCEDQYRWDLGDKTEPRNRSTPGISFDFPDTGSYTIRLITHDVNNCRDTAYRSVIVNTIKAAIGYDTLKGCLPLTIALSDSSVSDTLITSWSWKSVEFPFVSQGIGTTKNTSVTYTTSGTRTIELIVRDSLGCRDTAEVVVTPLIPDTSFRAMTDRTICAGDSVRFTVNNPGLINTYNWDFGSAGTSTDPSPYVTYSSGGKYNVTLSVVDTNGCAGDSTNIEYIEVQDYPIARITSTEDSNSVICFPKTITFTDSSTGENFVDGNRKWDLGRGNPINSALDEVKEIYDVPGLYDISLMVETSFGCKDTIEKTIEVAGALADFDMSDEIICVGETVEFTIKDTSDVAFYLWDFGDGTDASGQSPVSHTFLSVPSALSTKIQLIAWTKDSVCEAPPVAKTLNFEQVAAVFGLEDTIVCLNETVTILDTSLGADVYQWSVSDGQTFSVANPAPFNIKTAGSHTVQLVIENNSIGCIDTLVKELLVNPIPELTTQDEAYCDGDPVYVWANKSPHLEYAWKSLAVPSVGIDQADKDSTEVFPSATSDFLITVTDTNECNNSAVANVFIQKAYDPKTIDTCVVIGELIPMGLDLGTGYTYQWTGSETDLTWLKCKDCPTQTISITEEVDKVEYTLTYTDSLSCFDNEIIYNICILPSYTFDVPSAFTPDGDGVNDVVYLRGHGISEVLEFKIFNRWGELVFESTELTKGWDGIYKSTPQNMETYIYKAEVKFYNGKTEAKGGSLTLIR